MRVDKVDGSSLDRIDGAMYKKSLRVFVHCVGDDEEDSLRDFTVNELKSCRISGEITRPYPNQAVRSVVSENMLYCLYYCTRARWDNLIYPQMFYAYTSIGTGVRSSLTPPPFPVSQPEVCSVQNYIYLYDEDPSRSLTDSTIFDNGESCRGLYVYNVELDIWLPLVPMERKVRGACMTSCENTLYLIGGREPQQFTLGSGRHAQAFDPRTSKWRQLPPTHCEYENAACCALKGKIYVCGDTDLRSAAEAYDPVAAKWQKISSKNLPMISACRMVSYGKRLWAMDSRNLKVDVYEPQSDTWGISSLISDAARKSLSDTPCFIVDGVVF